MPLTITIAAFVLGAVLLLIGLLGGRFKIFAAEVDATAGRLARTVASVLGIALVAFGLLRELGILAGTSNTPETRVAGTQAVAETLRTPAVDSGSVAPTGSRVPGNPPAPEVEPPPDISGIWFDNRGWTYDVVQQGDEIEFTATNSELRLTARGGGRIAGRRLTVGYDNSAGASGTGKAIISDDGAQISGEYEDSQEGRFSATLYRR